MSRRIKNSAIWVVPVALIIATLVFHLFVWAITESKPQEFDFGTRPFVPGESPYSQGPYAR